MVEGSTHVPWVPAYVTLDSRPWSMPGFQVVPKEGSIVKPDSSKVRVCQASVAGLVPPEIEAQSSSKSSSPAVGIRTS